MSFKRYGRLVYINEESYLPNTYHYWAYCYIDKLSLSIKSIDCRVCFYEF